MRKKRSIIALILVLIIGVGIFSGCSSKTDSENGGQDVKIQDNTLKIGMAGVDIKTACIILAEELGFYEEEGVEVEFEKISSLADGLTAVSMDKLDILPFGVIPTCSYVSQGTDVVVIGGTISEGSEAITLPENKDNYNTIEDFKGKTLACFRMETGHMVMKGLMVDAGFDLEEDVNIVYMDSSASIVEAVLKGEADVGFVNSGYGYVAESSGAAVALQVGDFKEDFPCCRQTASRTTLNEKRDVLVNYMVANLRAYEVYLNDRETTIKTLAEYSGQEEKYVEAIMYGLEGEYDNAMKISLDPNKNSVSDFYETMKKIGDIDSETSYDINDYTDTSIYEDALKKMEERDPDNDLWKDLMEEFYENNN